MLSRKAGVKPIAGSFLTRLAATRHCNAPGDAKHFDARPNVSSKKIAGANSDRRDLVAEAPDSYLSARNARRSTTLAKSCRSIR
jgi:hypothetical protein